MAQVIININYREYPISCENGEEAQIIKLGRLLDDKARTLTKALGQINENLLLAMTGLLVADELNDTKKELATAYETISELKTVAVNSQISAVATEQHEEKPITGISEDQLNILDEEIAGHIDSLNEAIKSIALKLKSI